MAEVFDGKLDSYKFSMKVLYFICAGLSFFKK